MSSCLRSMMSVWRVSNDLLQNWAFLVLRDLQIVHFGQKKITQGSLRNHDREKLKENIAYGGRL